MLPGQAAVPAQADPDHFPGPVLLPGPAQDHRTDHFRAANHQPAGGKEGTKRQGAGPDEQGRREPEALQRLPPRAGRGQAAAGRDYPGPDHESRVHCLRRAGVLPGRVDPGADSQPAPGDAGKYGTDLPVHFPRPQRGAPHQQPHHRDVPGEDRGNLPVQGVVRQSGPPLHQGAAVGGSHRQVQLQPKGTDSA